MTDEEYLDRVLEKIEILQKQNKNLYMFKERITFSRASYLKRNLISKGYTAEVSKPCDCENMYNIVVLLRKAPEK